APGGPDSVDKPEKEETSHHFDDPMDDFQCRRVELLGIGKSVMWQVAAPQSLSCLRCRESVPEVVRFCRWVRDAGFTIYLPSLFGRSFQEGLCERGIG